MKHVVAGLLVLLFIGGAAYAAEPARVSMVELIATPERFNGQRVVVVGFAHLEFEGNALFLHKEDYDNGITKNSLRLSVPRNGAEAWEALSGGYVRIEARFKWDERLRSDLFSGFLTEITRFERWPPEKGQ